VVFHVQLLKENNMSEKNDSSKNRSQVIVPYGYMPYCLPEENGIDLRELWAMLKRRKKTIFTTMSMVVLPALIYLWMTKPVYEAKALLRLGSIESKPVEKPANLKTKLETIYHINDKNVKKEYPFISTISIPKKSDGLIQLTAQGLNNKSAQDKIAEVSKEIKSKYAHIIQSYIDLQKRYLTTKKSEADRLQKQIEQLSQTTKNQKKLLESMIQEHKTQEASILSMVYFKNLEKLTALQNLLSKSMDDINQIELSLSPINIKKTQLVGEIITYDHPVEPKKILIIAVSLITGLILGIFLALFLEIIGKEKKNKKTGAD
jgi:uncharacterized protein involved in exopolysaccharide biosynthesis